MMLIAPTEFPLLPQQERDTFSFHNYAPSQPHQNHGGVIAHRSLSKQLTFMAEVAFPTPSEILRSPVQQPAPAPRVLVNTAREKRRASKKAAKTYKEKILNTTKPKQTKSRDGMPHLNHNVLSWPG